MEMSISIFVLVGLVPLLVSLAVFSRLYSRTPQALQNLPGPPAKSILAGTWHMTMVLDSKARMPKD